MIQGGFEDFEGAKPARFSESEFCIGVQALDGGGGDLLFGAEPVQDELAVATEGTCELLDGLEARAQRTGAPLVEEPAGGTGSGVPPEGLQALLEQVGVVTPESLPLLGPENRQEQ